MELKNILVGLNNLKVRGSLDLNIDHIQNNSKKIVANYMFVAIKGFESNGHDHIAEAIKNGAKVIMAEQDEMDKNKLKEIPEDITVIIAEDTRYAF